METQEPHGVQVPALAGESGREAECPAYSLPPASHVNNREGGGFTAAQTFPKPKAMEAGLAGCNRRPNGEKGPQDPQWLCLLRPLRKPDQLQLNLTSGSLITRTLASVGFLCPNHNLLCNLKRCIHQIIYQLLRDYCSFSSA